MRNIYFFYSAAKKFLSDLISRLGGRSPFWVFSRVSLWLNPYNSLASFMELNRRSGGEWGLKNVVFEKDEVLFELFLQYGLHQKAQLLQDLAYLKFYSNPPSQGFFVEVGVGNGIHLSNSYFFEKEFGWRGLLVEPNTVFHDSIRKNRQAILDTRAALDSDGIVDFMYSGELSSVAAATNSDGHRRNGAVKQIKSTTLEQILIDHGAPEKIDFLSIDVEGAELSVLKGIDFNRRIISFITIEHNYNGKKRREIKIFLENMNYKLVSTSSSLWDDWYVSMNY